MQVGLENLIRILPEQYFGKETCAKEEGEFENNKLDVKGICTQGVNWCFNLDQNLDLSQVLKLYEYIVFTKRIFILFRYSKLPIIKADI